MVCRHLGLDDFLHRPREVILFSCFCSHQPGWWWWWWWYNLHSLVIKPASLPVGKIHSPRSQLDINSSLSPPLPLSLDLSWDRWPRGSQTCWYRPVRTWLAKAIIPRQTVHVEWWQLIRFVSYSIRHRCMELARMYMYNTKILSICAHASPEKNEWMNEWIEAYWENLVSKGKTSFHSTYSHNA